MIYRGLFSARDLLEQVAELIENSCGIRARHEHCARTPRAYSISAAEQTIGVFEENATRSAARTCVPLQRHVRFIGTFIPSYGFSGA